MAAIQPINSGWPRQRWTAAAAFLRDQYTLRRLRLAAGWVMFSYLILHFTNHALGNISLRAMMWGAQVHEWIWHGRVGGTALYSAFTIHFSLALWALYQRRSFRMGSGEWVRLVLGFSIVPLLIHHYLAGRWVYSAYGVTRRYDSVLLAYFVLHPFWGYRQMLVLVVAWAHGCMGMHFWLRQHAGYRRVLPLLAAFAVLLPALALLGIVQGARQVTALAQDPAWRAAVAAGARSGDPAIAAQVWGLERAIYFLYAGMVAAVLAARGVRSLVERQRGFVRISYPTGQIVRIPKGLAVLDASRRAVIPHASICGGRGRCSTCRVRILRGIESLPPPSQHEALILDRLHAPRNVRLACQLRPVQDIAVLPLLPPDIVTDDQRRGSGATDMERFVAIMFIDIRESSALVEKRLPYDVVFLLNHFFEAVGGAIVAVGGTPNQFLGDGMMAIFGMECEPYEACRQALAAAVAIHHRVAEMNRTLAEELPQPIKIGIGIHAGNVVLGELGYRGRFLLTAIGDAVHVAARLQELTKTYECQAVVSQDVGAAAGVALSEFPQHELRVRGRAAPLTVRVVGAIEALPV
jgi:adenylate cyclase